MPAVSPQGIQVLLIRWMYLQGDFELVPASLGNIDKLSELMHLQSVSLAVVLYWTVRPPPTGDCREPVERSLGHRWPILQHHRRPRVVPGQSACRYHTFGFADILANREVKIMVP